MSARRWLKRPAQDISPVDTFSCGMTLHCSSDYCDRLPKGLNWLVESTCARKAAGATVPSKMWATRAAASCAVKGCRQMRVVVGAPARPCNRRTECVGQFERAHCQQLLVQSAETAAGRRTALLRLPGTRAAQWHERHAVTSTLDIVSGRACRTAGKLLAELLAAPLPWRLSLSAAAT